MIRLSLVVLVVMGIAEASRGETPQDVDPALRQDRRQALKRAVDARLARAVRDLRDELHRAIDAAFDAPAGEDIETVLRTLDHATPEAPGGRATPSVPSGQPADGFETEIARLEMSLADLAAEGATEAQLGPVRQRVKELRQLAGGRRGSGGAAPSGPAGPSARFTGDAVPVPLGLDLGGVSPECQEIYGGGARVIGLDPHGPAARAGLLAGDIVLGTSLGAVADPVALARVLRGVANGKSMELTVLRRGRQDRISLTRCVGADAETRVSGTSPEFDRAVQEALNEVFSGNGAVTGPEQGPESKKAESRPAK